LFDLANEVNKSRAPELARQLKGLAGVLGLLARGPADFLQAGNDEGGLTREAIEAMIDERAAAKKARNFTEADRLRKALTDAGIVLEDGPLGTTWRRA
jgi:cysteinyl-tRNA synthetase